jgi:5-oxoprolinase (ATP-hydrolysing) subunit C
VIELGRVTGLATVQDGGRPGLMHAGVPPGGAMVPARLAYANAVAGNAPGAAALESFGDIEIVARREVLVATDDGVARTLAPSERARFARPHGRRVHYVAVRGGLDVAVALGGRGTLLTAGIGGHEGRALRRGDVLPTGGAAPADGPAPSPPPGDDGPIALVAGPDLDAFAAGALALLVAGAYTIAPTSDRTGTRLVGPRLTLRAGAARASAPMVRGAVEVPPDGAPIVLGPDHPTTGGYPVLACVASRDFGRFMGIPLGMAVRFVVAEQGSAAGARPIAPGVQ